MMSQSFTAKIYKLGMNPCVDVPTEVSRALGRRGYVPVKGAINGHEVRATLVPKADGFHRLFINGEMRKRAGVGEGDSMEIVIEIDTESREIPMPPDLETALTGRQALEAFVSMTPSHRRELLRYLVDAKTPETRRRRVQRIVDHVLELAQRR